jgi:AcrR family transcriptional regulator
MSSVVVPIGKREQTKVANRQAIMEAARGVFEEIGFEAATVRDIIRRTPLSVGAFYNYFRSKEEVAQALAEDGARRFAPILRAQRERAGDFESYLRAGIHAYFEFIAEDFGRWADRRGLGDASVQLRSDTPEMQAVFEEVRGSFLQAMAKGQAPQVDADYLAAAAIALTREVGEAMMRRDVLDVDGAADFCVKLILGGVPALPRRED